MKISVITVCFNAEKYLENAIQSVLSQTWQEKEYIIIDGGSTDATIDIIKKYEYGIDKWVSEPDEGIADAMNKGVGIASGEFIIFIHSDDYFKETSSLEMAANTINTRSSYDLYVFQVLKKFKNHEEISDGRRLGFLTNFKMGSCHQGHIIRRDLFRENGYFDTKFRISMDYDFTLRCYRNGLKSLNLNFPIAIMRMTGISSQTDWSSLTRRFSEEKRIHFKYCPSTLFRAIYMIYWAIYPFYRYCKFLLDHRHSAVQA